MVRTLLSSRTLVAAAAVTLMALVGLATPSAAVASPPDAVFDFPAGLACDFPLRLEVFASPLRVFREFRDKNGNVVRILTAGKGNTLVFTNLDNNETLTLNTHGSVEHITLNPDGTQTQSITGHNVLTLFPTDVPPGPSTTLHLGRVVFIVDTLGVFTLQSVSGRATDICAELS